MFAENQTNLAEHLKKSWDPVLTHLYTGKWIFSHTQQNRQNMNKDSWKAFVRNVFATYCVKVSKNQFFSKSINITRLWFSFNI